MINSKPSSHLAIDANGLGYLRNLGKQNSKEGLKEASKQFEALFIDMMLRTMRQATPKSELFDSHAESIYTSIYDQQISQILAQKGIGLADVMLAQLNKADKSSPQNPYLLDAVAPQSLKQIENQINKENAVFSDSEQLVNRPIQAKNTASVASFVDTLLPHALVVEKMIGIPANYVLGQAAFESGWGQHVINMPDGGSSYNFFGIKATNDWHGKVVEVATTEYLDGVPTTVTARFRAYDSEIEAFIDYASFLNNNPRYKQVIANSTNPANFAHGLRVAGYATDPAYSHKLINIINRIESI